MLTKISQKIAHKNNRIEFGYHCENGAHHDYSCCPTCWNKHPNPKLHLGKLSTQEMINNYSKYQQKYKLMPLPSLNNFSL